MPKKLKIKDILLEKDLGSFIDDATGGWDYRNVIPDQPFGKAKGIDKLKTKSVTGDDAAHAAAKASVSIDSIKDRLVSLGVSTQNISDQNTIDFYKALKEFKFTFNLNKAIPGFFDGQKSNIKGMASVDQRSNAKKFVMYFTHNKEKSGEGGAVYRINFHTKTLQKNLRGTEITLPMLIENNEYKVRISLKNISSDGGWGDPGTQEPSKEGNEEPIKDIDPNDDNPPVPPEIKKNRNEIFRLLLKNYGGYNSKVVYGDGFYDQKEAAEYQKLMRSQKKGEVEKSELESFRKKSSRDDFSMMIAGLRKSFPTTFLKKLDKAFPEFNLSYKKEMGESFDILLEEDKNVDKYKRWSIVFGKSVGKSTIDELDKNIRGFMAAVKKWFASPITYRGKTQSYNISFDGDKVNQYWKNFYGSKKESISMFGILDDLLLEKKKEISKSDEYGIGVGEKWEDKEKLPEYWDRVLLIKEVPTFEETRSLKKRDDDDGENSNLLPAGKNSKIFNIKGSSSTWTSDGIEMALNDQFKNGNVQVKKSQSKKDTLILFYKGIKSKLNTDAVLISKDNIENLFLGNKLNKTKVKIGPKAAGYDDFKEEGEAEITLVRV